MIDFRESMNCSTSKMNNDKKWDLLEKSYNNYFQNKGEPKIPKKIHQIWLGKKQPENYEFLKESWIKNHPDWEYKLWTDKDIESFNMINKKIFDLSTNLGSKSDIWRYEILYREGGLYIDTDFLCIKSINSLINTEFIFSSGQISEPEIFNGLIASIPYHPILKNCIDKIGNINTNSDNFEKIMQLTGPKFLTNNIFEYIDKNINNILYLPTTFFYPFPAIYRHIKDLKVVMSFKRPETYAIHLWYTSWQKNK